MSIRVSARKDGLSTVLAATLVSNFGRYRNWYQGCLVRVRH